MNTAAPTIRALELENQKLRADVAELVEALNLAVADVHFLTGFIPGTKYTGGDKIRAVLAKHGA